MKIIAKECPKCGANLNFKVGDKEVHCNSCRRDFVIEYDHSKHDLTPEDFKLDPSQKLFALMVKIMAITIFIISIGIMIFSFVARQRMIEGLKDEDFSSTPIIIDER